MKRYPFDQIVEDSTSKFKKIKKEDYLLNGQYKIVDQGKQFIAGYTNDKEIVKTISSPIIIFGDHTKIFKFVDFPLALGADGAKALTINEKLADSKYVYYYFKTLNLPDAGYSRHFKFLKKISIPLPESFDDQIRIVTILEKTEALIAKRKDSIKTLEDLSKSIFFEMFGDPSNNEKGWAKTEFGSVVRGFRNGQSPDTKGSIKGKVYMLSAITGDNFNGNEYKVSTFKSINDNSIVKNDDFLICRGNGNKNLVGRSVVVRDISDKIIFPDTVICANIDSSKVNKKFIEVMWKLFFIRRQIEKFSRTTNGTYKINQKSLKDIVIIVPPLSLQNKFAGIVERIETLKVKYNKSLTDLENLYGSLSQQAFKGELDLRRVMIETKSELSVVKKIEKRMPASDTGLNKSVKYSEATLLEIIQSKLDKTFSFETLMSELEKASFNEMPKYEDLRDHIYRLLEDSKIIQSLEEVINDSGKIEKKLMLRVNI